MKHFRSVNLLTYLLPILVFSLSSCSGDMESATNGMEISSQTKTELFSELGNGGVCGTPAPEPPAWFFTRAANSTDRLNYNTAYVFKIYVHVVRSSSGVGLDKTEISSKILETLNSYYGETNLEFTAMGSEYIDSDEFNLVNKENCALIFGLHSHSNAIDIYVFSSGENLGNLAGLAKGIPEIACLVRDGNYANSATLIHEVGHCLGLYHTHHGTAINGYAEGGDRELVDGSNSDVAGDYITDTPADPCEWGGWGNYVGVGVDANGDIYRPDPLNVMSYSGGTRNKLTQKQIKRIFSTIQNNLKLQNTTWPIETGEIEGPSYFERTATYSIDVPDGYTVDWKIACTTYTSSTSSFSYVEYKTGKQITLTNRNPQAASQRYVFDVTITTPKGYVFYASKTVYHVLFSANTGTLRWSTESADGNFNGQINLTTPPNSSPIKIYRGGKLYFYYSDANGSYSVTEPSVYNFEITNGDVFVKMAGGNHAFSCSNTGVVNTSEFLLHLLIGTQRTIMSIPYQVLVAK